MDNARKFPYVFNFRTLLRVRKDFIIENLRNYGIAQFLTQTSTCTVMVEAESVTWILFSTSAAAQISVLAMREEGEGSDRHVVYDVTVLKEYQISCRLPVGDGQNTTIHMETPMECLEGDHGCRAMAVGRDHRYLVVGTTTSDGKWLLKDSKGSGGCAISGWIPKYDGKMDKWASQSTPSESTCVKESV